MIRISPAPLITNATYNKVSTLQITLIFVTIEDLAEGHSLIHFTSSHTALHFWQKSPEGQKATALRASYLADDVNKVFSKVSKKISKVKMERLLTIKS